MSMKNVVALVVGAHGVGFTMWFLASWVPGVKVTTTTGHLIASGDVAVTDPIGKATGILALAVMVGFLAVAWGIFAQTAWWEALGVATSLISLVAIVIPWWSVVPPMSATGAVVVDLAIIGFAVLPSWNDSLTASAT